MQLGSPTGRAIGVTADDETRSGKDVSPGSFRPPARFVLRIGHPLGSRWPSAKIQYASTAATTAQKPRMRVGRRRKHLLHDTPSVIDLAYRAIATIATTSTNSAGPTSQAMRPTVPIRQNVNARRSYFSGRDKGGRT